MSETQALFAVLRETADAATAAAIQQLVKSGADRDLVRINVLAFAAERGLDEERTIVLHAAQLGTFELSWDVLCPTCGGVLDITTSLKDVHKEPYECALCCRSFELSLDEMADRDAVPVLQDDREKPWAELGIDYEHRVLTRLAQSLSSPTSCGRGGLGERLRVAFLRGEQNAQYASQVTTPHRAGRPIVGKAGFPRPTVSPCGQTPLCLVKLRQGPRTIT